MIKIQKLEDVIDRRGIKILVYGASGAGKTRAIETLPGRVLIASAEAGLLSLAQGTDSARLDVVEITSIDGLREVHRVVSKAGHGYDWVVLDSVSEIAETCLVELKKKNPDPRAAYGAIQDEIGGILRAFRDLDVGVYFSAKEAREKDEATQRVSYGIMMPGAKLGLAIPYIFDEVFRLVVVDDKDAETGVVERVRWLLTASDSKNTAKDRSGVLDPYEPCDLGAIAAKIKAARPERKKSSNGYERHNEDNDTNTNEKEAGAQ